MGQTRTRAKKAKKYVYFFGGGRAEGNAGMKDLLGGKGSNLAEMTNLRIPVPAGFTLTTDVCSHYQRQHRFPAQLKSQVEAALRRVEKAMGACFGDVANPLLVSVRSGARVSMPGMMDTVLNIGLNDETVQGLAEGTQNPRFAYDCYRRFVQMYGDVVLGLKPQTPEEADPFEEIIEEKKRHRGVALDYELSAEDLKDLVVRFKRMTTDHTGRRFPDDPLEQLWGAIGAVFGSWENKRAVEYRRIYRIPDHWGTAATVQTMVFGNMGEDSATGVAFTRDPATGANRFYGEYLINAQGEDVVAGIRTPQPINRYGRTDGSQKSLKEVMPRIYRELTAIYRKLERHYREMQDIEFTVQRGRLWLLQTRKGKRTAQAAVKMAVDMAREGLISKGEAVLRIEPDMLDQLLHPTIDPKAKPEVIATGLPASPGAASGAVVFSADEAVERVRDGAKVVLVRLETSPEDIHGMEIAEGILTARGGMTSHAAVVARGMGKPCVAGCGALDVDYEAGEFRVGGHVVRRGDAITLDGATGRVMVGKVPMIKPSLTGDFGIILRWADGLSRMHVRTNADTPRDAKVAIDFGAKGIGLCRTEHMFFEGERIDAMREMILAQDLDGRQKALAKLLPMQRDDFIGIFKAMRGFPVIIRTLDPPLHEFLPHTQADIADLAAKLGVTEQELESKVRSLHEANPMLGHRGCRLGISYPEITAMQARAVFEAACEVRKQGYKVFPEVMIPLVGDVEELRNQRQIVEQVAREVMAERKTKIRYLVGTMIEIPRAALTADQIAREADFFSYGTNDLTQTTFGLSRDDAGKFLPGYVSQGLLPADPFQKLDPTGVGQLVDLGIRKGRSTKKDLEIGICGEHGGEPSSIEFCHRVGMDYVSCSPYRVPIARLACAHAALRGKIKVVVRGEA